MVITYASDLIVKGSGEKLWGLCKVLCNTNMEVKLSLKDPFDLHMPGGLVMLA